MNTCNRNVRQRAENIISILIEPRVDVFDSIDHSEADCKKMLSTDRIDFSFTLPSDRLPMRRKRSCGCRCQFLRIEYLPSGFLLLLLEVFRAAGSTMWENERCNPFLLHCCRAPGEMQSGLFSVRTLHWTQDHHYCWNLLRFRQKWCGIGGIINF